MTVLAMILEPLFEDRLVQGRLHTAHSVDGAPAASVPHLTVSNQDIGVVLEYTKCCA